MMLSANIPFSLTIGLLREDDTGSVIPLLHWIGHD